MKIQFKTVLSKLKRIFMKVDAFREHIEDHLAEILKGMSKFTSLDEIKEKLIETAITAAISFTPVAGGAVAALTSEQIKVMSEIIVEYGHKAEDLLANQLAKH